MSDVRIVSRKQLPGETRYHFCPSCVKEFEGEGKDYHELPPLFKVLTATHLEGYQRDLLETKWECPRCRAMITTETFLHYYSEKR